MYGNFYNIFQNYLNIFLQSKNVPILYANLERVILYNKNVSYFNLKKNHFLTNVVKTQNFFEHLK